MNTLPVVKLRAMEPEDLDMLYAIENDQQLWAVGVTSVPYSRYVLHDYIANTRNDIYADGQVRFIVENEGGVVVGIADLMNFDPKNNKAELGIAIMCEHRRKGYAAAAIRQLAHYATSVLHLHQLYVVVAASNAAAVALFRNAGYEDAFTLLDWLFDGKKYEDARLLQTFL
jgi:Acetyltransferases, including N-acetylases of ribosomal proteins